MKKKGMAFFMPLFWIGLLLQNISNYFKESFTEFSYGFFQGLSFVFIIAGFLFICGCFRKKINPFTLKEWDSK